MMSALKGGHGKVNVVKRLREIYSINQFQMQTRGEEVKKSEKFTDVINGCSPTNEVAEYYGQSERFAG